MRKFRLSTLRWLALLLFLGLFGAIVLRWLSLERLRSTLQRLGPPTLVAPIVPSAPTPTPWRTPIIGGRLDTAKLWSGITVHAEVDPTPGAAASLERSDPQSYVIDLSLKVRMPKPNDTLAEVAKVTPQLPKLLPKLAEAFTTDSVSPLFRELYEIKVQTLRTNLTHLNQLLSRHNFYDCQTILRLRDPTTKRQALLLQADMDVDADGSDADRLPVSPGGSMNFKPFTSYHWKKKTDRPSLFLAPAEEKLERYETEFALKGLTMERNRDLRIGIQRMREEVSSLKHFSFLIASTDPYIVLPGIFVRAKDAGQVGDYALVVVDDQLYPAIVGDVGPSDRVGEASLRIAKEINARSTAYNRPVSDLKVTYLIFPGTADKPFGPPNLDKIQARCEALVKEIGGASVPLHHWENLIPLPPTPTPTPTPTAAPTSSPSPAPEVSPTFAFPTPSASESPSSSPSVTVSPSPTNSPVLSPSP
ncbi:MAG TPA: glycoside hydrolase family 75 protein [Chthoniobacterales bacterium]